MKHKAIIYCRVSSEKQKKEGHGLESQEHRCRQFAEQQELEVEAVFKDDISGGSDDRSGMTEMLRFMEVRPAEAEKIVVVIDDIKRWARDVEVHYYFRRAVMERNGVLRSPNFKFGESPEDKFFETMMAAHAELERGQNARQVSQKMKARLEAGYWCFDVPPGYRYEKVAGHGKLLVPDDVKDAIVKEALEGFASGRLPEQTDVQQFLASRGFFHRKKPKKTHLQQVKRLLTRVLYAGYIEYPKWGVTRRKGQHQGLISLPTFERIEERLGMKAKAPKRADINADFPLRGFVCCAECKKPMTASWSKGRKDKHPYYRCNHKSCALYNKSIKRKKIEDEFAVLLRGMTPKQGIVALTKAVILDYWQNETANVKRIIESREQRIKDIEAKIKRNHERIEETDDESLIQGYEERIAELKQDKLRLGGSVKKMRAAVSFETALDKVMQFVANPSAKWEKGVLEEQRVVLRLVFTEKLLYRKDTGFETASLSLPFELSGMVGVDHSRVVDKLGKSLHRLEQLILGWAEQISSLAPCPT